MIRTLFLFACLAIACGCSAARKTALNPADGPAAEPKQYDYKDMSSGSQIFQKRQPTGPGPSRL